MPGRVAKPKVALYYAADAYMETVAPVVAGRATAKQPGLLGRRVAGKEFLDAYLRFGDWSELVAVVPDRRASESLVQVWKGSAAHPIEGRRLPIVRLGEFHRSLIATASASVLHVPSPPEPRFAWARQQGGTPSFALSGVTHTLCSAGAVDLLCDLVTGPFEAFDRLICTSRAVEAMVRAVTRSYADYLADRHGGKPSLALTLETIPLGVDTERFRPPRADERAERRGKYGVADDEVAALFVGRLSHHAKAHPFPMFRGLAEAARVSGRRVHLLLAGWAAHPAVRDAFLAGARDFSPGVRVTLIDGTDPAARMGVWHAADLFVSLSDNIQETFGLAVIEAMACGLPVVASDWDGYRDLVVPGETGYLVPTAMVEGATADATARLLVGEVGYDHFLAECSQATAVDVVGAGEALGRLIGDETLRRAMGDAGRRRALNAFAWPIIIRAYESLWARQETERVASTESVSTRWKGAAGPARYPAPERSFAGYPTRILDQEDCLQAVPGAELTLERLLATPLLHHAADRRATAVSSYLATLERATHPCRIAELEQVLIQAGHPLTVARATIAWMLKYDLLRICSRG